MVFFDLSTPEGFAEFLKSLRPGLVRVLQRKGLDRHAEAVDRCLGDDRFRSMLAALVVPPPRLRVKEGATMRAAGPDVVCNAKGGKA